MMTDQDATRDAGQRDEAETPLLQLPPLAGWQLTERRQLIEAEATLSQARDHHRLWNVVIRRPTDFALYGYRSREAGPDSSCGCRWFLPLAGTFQYDWGLCANPVSPRAGLSDVRARPSTGGAGGAAGGGERSARRPLARRAEAARSGWLTLS